MKNAILVLFTFFTITPLFSQATGFFDDFEDGSVDSVINGTTYTLWKADHPVTFGITESDGYLNIAYDRSAESAQWDNFNFTPPYSIDVSGNPVVTLKIRSDVATTFTVKPIYSNGTSDWLQQAVPADDLWHVYSFNMVESNYTGALLTKIYLYLDGGSTDIKSGLVRFDDFQVAGFSIHVLNLEATLVDSSRVDLNWDTDDQPDTEYFNIYRSTEAGFMASPENRIAQITETSYSDSGLANYTRYYYQVSATDIEGREHNPAEISIRTYSPGSAPKPVVLSENANPVAKYEKYELVIDMPDADYENPYDPDEIDLRAWFFSPDGDSVMMNGFYDDYQGADQWKIRFSANQPGTWEYRLLATDRDGTGSSERLSFTVEESDHKGWLRISPDNPNYLMYDDGSSFYGLAVYYPWSTSEQGLDGIRAAGGNFFGYWDCTFDWAGNGGGRNIMESMESGIGRYDQGKAARIDQILEWAEDRDLKVMLAIWAHPYLRVDNVPWDDGLWYENNPYSEIVAVEDFYTDSLALSYQEKHHRYLIARFGYSRALGIWELINEIHGTSGWVASQENAKKWVTGVHRYFKANDPFQRATTASFGAGDGADHFTENDSLGDMPNIHFYEQHGFPNPYPGDVVRSGLTNVASESRKLKTKGDRPAFFGEAGYTSMLADVETEEYTWELHNAFWAGLTNGLATTPFWWEYNHDEILSPERMQTYAHMVPFVSGINFAHQRFSAADINVENADGYFMGADTSGFGWMKNYTGSPVAGSHFNISGTPMDNGTSLVSWFDTWTGEYIYSSTAYRVEGCTWGDVPDTDNEDIAFRVSTTGPGGPAEQVRLYFLERDSIIPDPNFPWRPGRDTTLRSVVVYVCDGDELMDIAYNGTAQVDITYTGGEEPTHMEVDLVDGGTIFDYIPSGSSGALITVTLEGVGSAELSVDGIVGMDQDYMDVRGGLSLEGNYPNPFRETTTFSFTLADQRHVNLSLYDARGRLVETLVDQDMPGGRHRVEWNASTHPAGVYFCTLGDGEYRLTKGFVILK